MLVFTESGPQYWYTSDAVDRGAKQLAASKYYTHGFANMLAQHLLRAGGIAAAALRDTTTDLRSQGCETTRLLCRQSQVMAELACHIMESRAMSSVLARSRKQLQEKGEHRAISIDTTYKVALKAYIII